MKISEITFEQVKEYLRIYDNDEDTTVNLITNSAKSFIKSYTGLSDEEADQYEDLCIAFLCLCSDMFDNRTVSVQSDKINPIVDTILHMHSKNYL